MTTVESTAALRGGVWTIPQGDLRRHLTGDDLRELEMLVPPRQVEKGGRVYRHGDVADGCMYVLLGGRVKVSVPGTASGERVLAVFGAGDLFGTALCAGQGIHTTEAVSLGGVSVVTIAPGVLQRVTTALPRVALALSTALAERVQTLEEDAEMARLPAQARLARTVLRLAERFGVEIEPDVVELALELRHDELASLAAATRVSATRAFSAWRTLGVVEGTRGQYRVHVSGLRALVEVIEEDQLG